MSALYSRAAGTLERAAESSEEKADRKLNIACLGVAKVALIIAGIARTIPFARSFPPSVLGAIGFSLGLAALYDLFKIAHNGQEILRSLTPPLAETDAYYKQLFQKTVLAQYIFYCAQRIASKWQEG